MSHGNQRRTANIAVNFTRKYPSVKIFANIALDTGVAYSRRCDAWAIFAHIPVKPCYWDDPRPRQHVLFGRCRLNPNVEGNVMH